MATYGYDQYGLSTYGPSAPTGNYPGSQITVPVVNTAYIFPNLAANVLDYRTILVSWGALAPGTNATVTEFRLLTNTWGFPVDQNDGTIVLDVTGAPPAYGYQFTDTSAVPGTVQYYGIYILSGGVWLRGGFTAALLPNYYGYDIRLMSDLPPYFQNQDTGNVSADVIINDPGIPTSGGTVVNPYSFDVEVWINQPANVLVNGIPLGMVQVAPLPAAGSITITYGTGTTWQWLQRATPDENVALEQYLQVVGMGLDLVKTQYDMKFNSLNDPMTMSLGDLANLCAEIGLPYNAEIPAYTTRKAALFWGRVMQERGTLGGIAENITLLTGYPADVQVSRNILLDDDQANPADPIWPKWSSGTHYNVGEMVTFPVANEWSVMSVYNIGAVVLYNDLFYTCTVNGTTAIVPTNVANWSQNVNGPYLYYCLVANQNNQPSGSLSANTWWSAVYGGNRNGSEYTASNIIPDIGSNAGTWEFMAIAGTSYGEAIGVGFPTPQTWTQSGTTPTTGPNGYGNTFRALNASGSTVTNAILRSVARSAADIAASRTTPDPQLVVEHAIPVPSNIPVWSASTVYKTNAIVSYAGVNYIALRQSKGATPPLQQSILNSNWDFETGVSPWFGVNATVTQSTTFAYHGTHSMSIVATGASPHATSENIPVIPGATYQATALVISTGTPTVSIAADWSDIHGGFINGSFPTGTVLVASTWTEVSNVFTVPVNASTVFLAPSVSAASTSYWDIVELTCVATPEWAPLGADTRIPITMSGYAISDLGFAPTVATTVTPFVEWYDNWGNLINRTFARSPSSAGGYPTNYQYDAFNTGAGVPLAGRVPAIPSSVWSVPVGSWNISSDGHVYAGSADNDAIGAVASPAQGTVAATVTNPAQAGDDCGPMFWYSSTANLWMAGLLQLYYVASGTTRTVAYSGTLPAAGDRIYVEFNNTTSTTTIPTGTVIGPSVFVYKNSRTSANTLVVVGSGGTASQTAMSSLTTPSLPSTGATSSTAGIASIVV